VSWPIALGAVEVLEYSPLPAPEFMRLILWTSAEDIRGPLEFSVIGAVAFVQAVLGPVREAGRGMILFTTGTALWRRHSERGEFQARPGIARNAFRSSASRRSWVARKRVVLVRHRVAPTAR
jgi:hypothetical protein